MISPPLIRRDLKMIFRDPMMFLILMIPFLLTGLTLAFSRSDPLRYLPLAVDGERILSLLRMTLPLFGGLMSGWMTGFCLLEEKENGLEPQLDVSPLRPRSRLETRLLLTFLIGLGINLLLLAGDRLIYTVRGGTWTGYVLTALTGPFIMSIMDRWGKNRIQGLTLAKLTSLVLVPPLLAMTLPDPPFLPLLLLSPLTGFVTESWSLQAGGLILLILYSGGINRLLRKGRAG